mgnify:CR=1 FL=1|jgi:hypothetical protein
MDKALIIYIISYVSSITIILYISNKIMQNNLKMKIKEFTINQNKRIYNEKN